MIDFLLKAYRNFEPFVYIDSTQFRDKHEMIFKSFRYSNDSMPVCLLCEDVSTPGGYIQTPIAFVHISSLSDGESVILSIRISYVFDDKAIQQDFRNFDEALDFINSYLFS